MDKLIDTDALVENAIKEAPSVSFEDAIMAQGDSHVDKILWTL